MENVNGFIKNMLSVIVFIIGIMYMLYGTKIYNLTVLELREKLKGEEVIYQQYYPKVDLTPYSEIVTTLLWPLEYDMEIDGFNILKHEHSPDKILDYKLKDQEYIKSYQYDEHGKIIKIIFNSNTLG